MDTLLLPLVTLSPGEHTQATIPFSQLASQHRDTIRAVELERRSRLGIAALPAPNRSASRFVGQTCKLELGGEWCDATPVDHGGVEDTDVLAELPDEQEALGRALCRRLAAFLRGRDWRALLLERSEAGMLDFPSTVRAIRGSAGDHSRTHGR